MLKNTDYSLFGVLCRKNAGRKLKNCTGSDAAHIIWWKQEAPVSFAAESAAVATELTNGKVG